MTTAFLVLSPKSRRGTAPSDTSHLKAVLAVLQKVVDWKIKIIELCKNKEMASVRPSWLNDERVFKREAAKTESVLAADKDH